jgi:Tfp pilus assembly protein PilO
MALTVGAIVILGGLLGVAPKLEEVRVVTAHREVVESQNDEYVLALTALKQQFDGIAELRSYLVTLQTAVPPDAAIPAFVSQLEVIARQNNVTLDALTFGDAVTYQSDEEVTPPTDAAPEPADSDAAAADTSPFSDGTYLGLPIALSVQGAQSNLLDFVAGLQHGQRTVSISTLVTEGSAGTDDMDLAITGMIYVLLDANQIALTE